MTQRAAIIAKLEAQGYITNSDIEAMNREWVYTGRNRLTEEQTRLYFHAKGFRVSPCRIGKTFAENRWELEPLKSEQLDLLAVA